MNQEKLNYFKEVLERQLETLLVQSGQRFSVSTDQVIKLRIKSRESYLIKKISDALERIKNKTFGICEICEEEIAYHRLLARSVATKCILCKTEEERLERLAG